MINTQNIKDVKSFINSDNVHTLNNDSETPIEYMIYHYQDTWRYPFSTLILQHLLNMGADISPTIEFMTEKIKIHICNPYTKKFYIHALQAKSMNNPKTTTNYKVSKSINVAQENEQHPKRSQYTKQEKMQLERYANKLGISPQDNHLSLKIIKKLIDNNICYECTQKSGSAKSNKSFL
jgi:hypothetical protein